MWCSMCCKSCMSRMGSPCVAVCVAVHPYHIERALLLQCGLQRMHVTRSSCVTFCMMCVPVCVVTHVCLRRDHHGNYDAGTRIHDKFSLPIDRNQLTENVALGFARPPGARQVAAHRLAISRSRYEFFLSFQNRTWVRVRSWCHIIWKGANSFDLLQDWYLK